MAILYCFNDLPHWQPAMTGRMDAVLTQGSFYDGLRWPTCQIPQTWEEKSHELKTKFPIPKWLSSLNYTKGYIMIEVVAALIWNKDRFMICQRPANKARSLMWEFAGGKVEPGESKEQALIRECQEELAITLSVGNEFMEVVHTYPDITVHLTLFNSTIAKGIPQKLEHAAIRWITVDEVPQYEFCPADQEILKLLKLTGMKQSEETYYD